MRVFFKDLFEKYGATFAELGVDLNNGFGDLAEKIQTLLSDQKTAIEADIRSCARCGPRPHLCEFGQRHQQSSYVPSDVIVDARCPR